MPASRDDTSHATPFRPILIVDQVKTKLREKDPTVVLLPASDVKEGTQISVFCFEQPELIESEAVSQYTNTLVNSILEQFGIGRKISVSGTALQENGFITGSLTLNLD